MSLPGETPGPVFACFDSHCHLDADDYDADREAVLERAVAAGLKGILVPGTDLASSSRAAALAGRADEPGRPPIWAAVGVHPHSASEACVDPNSDGPVAVSRDALGRVRELSMRPRVVAIGETGLDYHYNFSPPSAQQASLAAHIRLALELDRPLILHCREAEADLLRILDEAGQGPAATPHGVRGVVHCYTGTPETAVALLERGFFLGFTGVITFRKSEALREIVRQTPLSRILIETDGPYLAPMPHRGRRNEPAFVPAVAAEVARLHGLEPHQAAAAAFNNTVRCFSLALEPLPEA